MAEEFENTSQDTQADVKGAGTMLAAPFEIAKQDTLLEVQQTVNKTDTTIGNIGDPAGEDSLVGLVKNIPKSVPTGAVKSVQRGVITSNFTDEKTIPINTVDPSKCIVIISHMSNYHDRHTSGCMFKSLNSNSLLLIGSELVQQASWQVVEFY